jgi:hypothetical protein
MILALNEIDQRTDVVPLSAVVLRHQIPQGVSGAHDVHDPGERFVCARSLGDAGARPGQENEDEDDERQAGEAREALLPAAATAMEGFRR